MIIDSYSCTEKGINIWHDMSDYDYKPPHLRCRQFASLIGIFHSETDSVPCLVSPALLCWFTEWDVIFRGTAAGMASPSTCQEHKAGCITLLQHVSLQTFIMNASPQPANRNTGVRCWSSADETTASYAWMYMWRIIQVFACVHICMFPSCLHVDVFK